MSFFKNFQKLTYDFTIQGETKPVKYGVSNILSRIRIYSKNYKKSGAVDVYTINDDKTGFDGFAIFGFAAGAGEGGLGFGNHDGQRGPQFVRGVRGELFLLGERGFEA